MYTKIKILGLLFCCVWSPVPWSSSLASSPSLVKDKFRSKSRSYPMANLKQKKKSELLFV